MILDQGLYRYEKWKDIPGYPGYQCSNLGRVKRLVSKARFLHRTGKEGFRPTPETIYKFDKKICGAGYYTVYLGSKKSVMVHRLIAMAFIPNPKQLPQVNHKNRKRLDNRVENLEWVTAKENINHASSAGAFKKRNIETSKRSKGEGNPKCKLTSEQVHKIRELGDARIYQQTIADRFRISQSTVSSIILRKSWAHI